jgi:2-polyprenyl-6-methoxyphenol hydroxylase-like FAD-dependent oxidoreductase
MSGPQEIPDESTMKREHENWIKDFDRWRTEHRDALLKLAAIQIAMLKRESALEEESRQIGAHESELSAFEQLGIDQFADPDRQIHDHSKRMQEHEKARQQHSSAKQFHDNTMAQINVLHKLCGCE